MAGLDLALFIGLYFALGLLVSMVVDDMLSWSVRRNKRMACCFFSMLFWPILFAFCVVVLFCKAIKVLLVYLWQMLAGTVEFIGELLD